MLNKDENGDIIGITIDGNYIETKIRDDMRDTPDAYKYSLVFWQNQYSKGKADYSTTELLQPPQRRHLAKTKGLSWINLSSLSARSLGTMIHSAMEEAIGHSGNLDWRVEKRYFADIDVDGKTYTISGCIDLEEGDTSYDLKCCQSSKAKADISNDYQWQLRINKWLASKNNVSHNKMKLTQLILDWSQAKVEYQKDFPFNPMLTRPVADDFERETEDFIRERIRLHESDVVHSCSAKERFGEDSCYAVTRFDGKRAIEKFPFWDKESEIKARKAAEIKYPQFDVFIDKRKGNYRGCELYCDVHQVCKQYTDNNS